MLVVVGGGTLIDQAKAFVATQAPLVRLVAVPTLWGSGAEASRITIASVGGEKRVTIDDSWVPEARVIWPELLETVSPELARYASGDVLTHALEGLLSPLAGPEVRSISARCLREAIELPVRPDPRWLDVSADACAAQARASVGLAHGIAHTLEGRVGAEFGHARLVSTFVWPVLEFDLGSSDKIVRLLESLEVQVELVRRRAREVFDESDYRALLPALEVHWPSVLRDPSTRLNSALVRPRALDHFLGWSGRE